MCSCCHRCGYHCPAHADRCTACLTVYLDPGCVPGCHARYAEVRPDATRRVREVAR